MNLVAVYIMANRRNGTLYTAVTSNLVQRVCQHRESVVPGFTWRYSCELLVWFEQHEDITGAIQREKQIKTESGKEKLRKQGPEQIWKPRIQERKRTHFDSWFDDSIPVFQIRFYPFTAVPPFGCRIWPVI